MCGCEYGALFSNARDLWFRTLSDNISLQNHDLDFGVPQFRHLTKQCNFPWLLANVLDPGLGDNVALGDCPKTAILESPNGIKIGLIGLAEREW